MNIDLEPIIEAAKTANPQTPGDYRDAETGLLMCGICHTRKETRVSLFGTEQTVPSMCRCALEKYEAGEAERREAERRRRIERRREICFGFHNRKAAFTFDADDGSDPQTMKLAKGYVERFEDFKGRGKGLLFLGGTGTGKTFVACCVANALLDKGYSVKVATFAEIAAKLQGNWDREEVYKELARYDLLVLDDLGAERDTSYMGEIIFTVIDTRSAAQKPIIVTTNIDGAEFVNGGELAKNRVFSGLYEMCVPVAVNGRDRRRERMVRETAADMALFRRRRRCRLERAFFTAKRPTRRAGACGDPSGLRLPG